MPIGLLCADYPDLLRGVDPGAPGSEIPPVTICNMVITE
jgi:hypothetical protein